MQCNNLGYSYAPPDGWMDGRTNPAALNMSPLTPLHCSKLGYANFCNDKVHSFFIQNIRKYPNLGLALKVNHVSVRIN